MSKHNLRPDDLDRLGKAIITLTKELWVAKDRIRILEAALVNTGALAPGAIDALQPDATLAAILETDRAELIDEVLSALEAHD